MQFTFRLEVPPKTPRDDPLRRPLELTAGEIRQITVLIPPGHMGLTGIRFLLRDQVILPASPDAWIQGNGVLLNMPEKFAIPDIPPRLTVEAYNEDEVHPHAFIVNITILPAELDVVEVLMELAARLERARFPLTKKQAEELVKNVAEMRVELENLRRVQLDQLIAMWREVFGYTQTVT